MSGHWTRKSRREDLHRCDRPKTGSLAQKGDLWTCDECQQVYEVIGLNDGSQHDPINPPLIEWNKPVVESPRVVVDERPHSRSCGPFCPGHKPHPQSKCKADCPTCGSR